MPGAVGQGSCRALLNCTAADVEAKLRSEMNKGSEVNGEEFFLMASFYICLDFQVFFDCCCHHHYHDHCHHHV